MDTNYNVTFTKDNGIEFTKDDSYQEVVNLTLTIAELEYLHFLVINHNIRATRNEIIHHTPKPIESDILLRKVDTLCALTNE